MITWIGSLIYRAIKGIIAGVLGVLILFYILSFVFSGGFFGVLAYFEMVDHGVPYAWLVWLYYIPALILGIEWLINDRQEFNRAREFESRSGYDPRQDRIEERLAQLKRRHYRDQEIDNGQ